MDEWMNECIHSASLPSSCVLSMNHSFLICRTELDPGGGGGSGEGGGTFTPPPPQASLLSQSWLLFTVRKPGSHQMFWPDALLPTPTSSERQQPWGNWAPPLPLLSSLPTFLLPSLPSLGAARPFFLRAAGGPLWDPRTDSLKSKVLHPKSH